MALLASLLHFLPLAATGAITWFITTEYFIGKELAGLRGGDSFKLLLLQFAAKIHELLMVSTLTTVIFTMVRHELVRGEGVPLALLSSGLSVSKVSFLWSKDFVALCQATYDSWYKKLLFLAAILMSIFLSVAVAPASATALTPIKRNWEAGGTKIWLNSTKERLFPADLNESHTLGPICSVSYSNNECPSAHWEELVTSGYLEKLPRNIPSTGSIYGPPEDLLSDGVKGISVLRDALDFEITSRYSKIQLNINPTTARTGSNVDHGFSNTRPIVSAPHIAISDSLRLNYMLWNRAAGPNTGGHKFRYRLGSVYKALVPLATASTECRWFTEFDNLNDTEYAQVIDWASSIANSSHPELFWFLPSRSPPTAQKSSFINQDRTSIAAAVYLPDSTEGLPVRIICRVEAGWLRTTLTGALESELPHPADDVWSHDGWWDDDSWLSPITIQPSFAQYTNPRFPDFNSTVFELMLISARLWNRDTGQSSIPVATDIGHLETVLNLMIVNGMVRTSPYTTQNATLKQPASQEEDDQLQWKKLFLPRGQFGLGGDAYNLTEEQKKNSFSFQMNVFAEGYGYSFSQSNAFRFSLIILFIQLAIAVSFIIWTITTGASSSSWDSPAELIALALASEEPSDRKGLATGESSIESLKKRYCVVADGDRLQLKEWRSKVPEEKRVKPNVAYE